MNERSTLELKDEMARLRDQLKLAAEQERASRERHTRELTPETEAAHEGRLEEMDRLLRPITGSCRNSASGLEHSCAYVGPRPGGLSLKSV